MDNLFEWVKGIVFFTLFSECISCLVNNKKYIKYINLATGLVFILVILHPVLFGAGIDSIIDSEYIKQQFIYDMDDSTYDFQVSEAERDKAILDEYRNYLFIQTSDKLLTYGYKITEIEFNIIDDKSVVNYGALKGIYMSVIKENLFDGEIPNQDEKQGVNMKGIAADRITIRKILVEDSDEQNTENDKDVQVTVEEMMLEEVVSDFYRIDVNDVKIEIQEE